MRREYTCRRVSMAVVTALALVVGGLPLAADEPGEEARDVMRTPPRLSFLDGPVSFWRPGAEDWTAAQINVPLTPGDQLYAGPAANLELQVGPRAFVRAGAGTQLGLDNQEPDFLQFRVTAGHVSINVQSMTAGHSIEVDTPNAAFDIDQTGYYRIDVEGDTTSFITRRGGRATMIPMGGQAAAIAPGEDVVVRGTDNPDIGTYAAPEIDDWDRWNYARTDHLIDSASARYLSPGMYGADALDHYGDWRVVDQYGPVWVPGGIAAGWSPYSTGRWVWDPFYGWTWVDEAPWGWAPYHYGRWVHVHGFWGWAPGPVVVAPVYAPALVAFFHGPHLGIGIGVSGPGVGWVPLGWGEPCIPWWGRQGFVGRPWWGGWGGPRIVNNVVVERTTVVNITNITYQNVHVPNAVVGAPEDRFGRGRTEHVRLRESDVRRLAPARGPLSVRPVPASLVPSSGPGSRPPAAIFERRVVAIHPPHDAGADLRSHGLNVSPAVNVPAPRVVNVPRGPGGSVPAPGGAPFGRESTTERPASAPPPRFGAPPQQPAVQQPGQPGQQAPATIERRMPAWRMPEQNAPAGVPPSAPAPGPRAPALPQQQAPLPHAAEQRAPARAAPAMATPRSAPPSAPQVQHAPPRELPGEPANRPFRGAPAAVVPHPQAPPPQRQAAPPAEPPQARQPAPASRPDHKGQPDR